MDEWIYLPVRSADELRSCQVGNHGSTRGQTVTLPVDQQQAMVELPFVWQCWLITSIVVSNGRRL